MNLPNHIIELNRDFYDYDEKGQNEALAKLLNFANANRNIIENFIPVANDDELDLLSLIFETLALDADKWSDYYLLAVDQLLVRAETTAKPDFVLTHLDAYTYLTDKPGFKHKTKLVNKLLPLLTHPHPTFRWYGLKNLPDFIQITDYEIIKRIYTLLEDKNWRIRYWADLTVKNLDASYKSKLLLTDKLRAKFFSTVAFD